MIVLNTSPRLNGTLQVLIGSRFVPPHIPQVCGTRCDCGVLRLRAISVHCAVETEVPRGHAGETRGNPSWMIAIICYHYYCIYPLVMTNIANWKIHEINGGF